MKPSTERRLVKRYAENYLREAGLTREQLEGRVAQIVRRRPRLCPRWLWALLLCIVVNPKQLELVRRHQLGEKPGTVKS